MAEVDVAFDTELIREASRLCERYVDEIVLGFDLCPWAAPALRAGRVQISVITREIRDDTEFDLAARAAADALEHAAQSPLFELVLLVFPRCVVGRLAFDEFQRAVRDELSMRARESGEVAFALAAFHPEAAPDVTTPERLIPYLRRSPDPLLQAVRSSVLERIEGPRPSGTGFVSIEQILTFVEGPPARESLRLRVARANQATFEAVGQHAIEERLESIHDDRKATYARLLGDGWRRPSLPSSGR